MNTTDVPKVTSKDTKTVILGAYRTALEKLKDYQAASMNPKQKIAEKEKADTVVKSNMSIANLSQFVQTAVTSVDKALSGLDDVNAAIDIKKGELKTLFDIETEALSLAALVDANAESKRKFEAESEEKATKLREDLEETKTLIYGLKEEAELKRNRDKEEWQYNFERAKTKQLDELNDKLAQLTKQTNDTLQKQWQDLTKEKNDLHERHTIIEAAEQELESLKAQVESMPDKIAEAVKVGVGKEKGMMERRFEQDKKFFERDVSAKLDLVEAQNITLENENATLKTQINMLNDKLENAYREMKDISIKTVEGAGNSQMFSEMKTLLKDRGPNK